MLDVVTLAMFVIVPILCWSIYQVRVHRRYSLHKKVQIALCVVLLITVVLFEVDVRINGWRHLAKPSPYYHTILFPVLYVHLFFAITTTLLWLVTAINAIRRFEASPQPNEYSATHKILGRLAALDMICTSVTGWTFYYLAFVAS